jgi:tripartite ATP-independent transporter DctM subunit
MATTAGGGQLGQTSSPVNRIALGCLDEKKMPGSIEHIFRSLTKTIEWVAGTLVAIEIIVLFVGVVARYAFRRPIIWSDELASILFIWLVMFGALLALMRNEHMRMTALVVRAPQRMQQWLDSVATAVALAFVLIMAWPAYENCVDSSFILSPALEISTAWRAAALPIGFVLMAVVLLNKLARATDRLGTILAVAAVALAIVELVFLSPVLKPLANINLLIFFVGFVGLMVFGGVAIGFSFGLATIGYLALATDNPLMIVAGRMDEGMGHTILLSVPLFVFLGLLLGMTGLARAMIQFLANLVGHVRGGLSFVLIGAMYLVSGISGSKAADMAAIAPALFPEMQSRGAKPGELVALLAATGAQTETIPPSLVLIAIGSVTGISIAALFTGGLLPAALLGIMLCALVWFRYRNEDLSSVARATWSDTGKTFLVALPALGLPFVIRAAVVEGVATATEVSTIGIVYAALAGLLVYRQFDWRRLGPMLVDTATLSGAILFIIGAATAMAWALTQSVFARDLAVALGSLPGGKATFLGVSILAFVALGSLLEGIPAIVLFGPLLFPIAKTMGVHEVHYAVVVILAMGIGLFAPPFGVGYYAACAIGRVDPREGMKPIWGYLFVLLIGIVIIAAFPWLSIGFL